MLEIRTIHQSEGEEFLQLLCQVFDLSFEHARGVFFSEPLFDLRRKWGLWKNGKLCSILTTVPLQFGWGNAFGIAGVATLESERRSGLAGTLIAAVLEAGKRQNEPVAFLFAERPELYERCGFSPVDTVIKGFIADPSPSDSASLLAFDDVKQIYDAWSHASNNRLQRSDARWDYWKWNLRVCTEIPNGYVCEEGHGIREAVLPQPLQQWPVQPGAEWTGLLSLTKKIEVPLEHYSTVMHLLAHGTDTPPELFMTDQF